MNKEQRYFNARQQFLKEVRNHGDGTAQALEEYKIASDDYFHNKYSSILKHKQIKEQKDELQLEKCN